MRVGKVSRVGLVVIIPGVAVSGSWGSVGEAQVIPQEEEFVLAGTVASRISYQGRLATPDGAPLEGFQDMVFQIWNAATAGDQLGWDVIRPDVPVTDGRFSVVLDVPQIAFDGQAVWLRIQVDSQWLSPRQELLPVPYALGLRPGAVIDSPAADALHVWNREGGYAVEAWSQNSIAVLASNGAPSEEGPPSGMYGVHARGAGACVVGKGGHTGGWARAITPG